MYALTFSSRVNACRNCGDAQKPGVVGWRFSKDPGALCDVCLTDKDPELGAVLVILHLAREVGAAAMEGDGSEEMLRVRYLHTFCRVYERGASTRWPRRLYVFEGLQEVVDHMEELHGT